MSDTPADRAVQLDELESSIDPRHLDYRDGPAVSKLLAVLVEQAREIAALKADARATYCAYCGHRTEIEDRDEAARQITEHIRTCPKHPMRAVEANLARVTAERDGLRTDLTSVRDMPEYDQDDALRLRAIARQAIAAVESPAREPGAGEGGEEGE